MTFEQFCNLRNWYPTEYQKGMAKVIIDAINSDPKLSLSTAAIGTGTTEVFKMIEAYYKLKMAMK
jgi:hypothetical protein